MTHHKPPKPLSQRKELSSCFPDNLINQGKWGFKVHFLYPNVIQNSPVFIIIIQTHISRTYLMINAIIKNKKLMSVNSPPTLTFKLTSSMTPLRMSLDSTPTLRSSRHSLSNFSGVSLFSMLGKNTFQVWVNNYFLSWKIAFKFWLSLY